MAVKCKKCGGPHPVWDCKASTAQIAAYEREIHERASVAVADGGAKRPAAVPTKSGEVRAAPAREQAQVASVPRRATDARNDHQLEPLVSEPIAGGVDAGAQPGKRPRGRPRTITDMRAYKAEHERKRRERRKSKSK